MKPRYLIKQALNRKRKSTWIEVGILKEGTPVLVCEGKVIQNTYVMHINHDRPYDKFDANLSITIPSTMSADAGFVVDPNWKYHGK